MPEGTSIKDAGWVSTPDRGTPVKKALDEVATDDAGQLGMADEGMVDYGMLDRRAPGHGTPDSWMTVHSAPDRPDDGAPVDSMLDSTVRRMGGYLDNGQLC